MEIHNTPSKYDRFISIQSYEDPNIARFILSGERFKEESELLSLLVAHNSACTLDTKAYAAVGTCDFNCQKCKHSIYSMLEIRKKFFVQKCEQLCDRKPKEGDEWELSLVMRDPRIPKYQSFFFQCHSMFEERTILEIMHDVVWEIDPTIFRDAQYRYVKIRRFDMPKALDVSIIANPILSKMAADSHG